MSSVINISIVAVQDIESTVPHGAFCLLGKGAVYWGGGAGIIAKVLRKKAKKSKMENQGLRPTRKVLRDDPQDLGYGGHS